MNRLYMSKPEVLERLKARAWTWFRGWKKTLWRVAKKKPVNLALWLPFINEGVRP